MPDITVRMKDGTVRSFPEESRPGGSYQNKLSFEGEFAVVRDVRGRRTAIPAQDVIDVTEDAPRSRW